MGVAGAATSLSMHHHLVPFSSNSLNVQVSVGFFAIAPVCHPQIFNLTPKSHQFLKLLFVCLTEQQSWFDSGKIWNFYNKFFPYFCFFLKILFYVCPVLCFQAAVVQHGIVHNIIAILAALNCRIFLVSDLCIASALSALHTNNFLAINVMSLTQTYAAQ